MDDAILEVNHWCHEKANYQPSDARTSSPLATVRTAYGRCGEESTLLVAALRSVGIPARQVLHAPLGAHRRQPRLGRGLGRRTVAFPRGLRAGTGARPGVVQRPGQPRMLMHTKVFGYYDGSEEVMKTTANYTEINVISNYAAMRPLTVTVTDTAGSPRGGCDRGVQTLQLRRVLHRIAQNDRRPGGGRRCRRVWAICLSRLSVMAGLGFGRFLSGRETEATVVLEHAIGDEFSFPIDIVPPTESANLPEVTAAQRAENDRRFNREDSIRNAYIATFPAKPAVAEFAVLSA